VVGKTTTACTKFEDVDRVVGIEGGLPVAQETKDDFGIGVGDEGIAGDVVRDSTMFPGVNALLGEVVTLKLPEQGLGERLV